MVDGIGMALSSLKSASDLAKSLIELRDIAKVSELSIELNGKIAAAQQLALSAQQEQAALIGQIGNLEKQIVEFENWEREKQRYVLHDHGSGTFAYVLKDGMENGEPPHKICANCCQKGEKSILQFQHNSSNGQTCYRCPNCENDFWLGSQSTQSSDDYSSYDPLSDWRT